MFQEDLIRGGQCLGNRPLQLQRNGHRSKDCLKMGTVMGHLNRTVWKAELRLPQHSRGH